MKRKTWKKNQKIGRRTQNHDSKYRKITNHFSALDALNTLALEAFPPEEYLTSSQLIEIIAKRHGFDKKRTVYRTVFTECDWSKKESYHLCIHTSGKEIKTLIPGMRNM